MDRKAHVTRARSRVRGECCDRRTTTSYQTAFHADVRVPRSRAYANARLAVDQEQRPRGRSTLRHHRDTDTATVTLGDTETRRHGDSDARRPRAVRSLAHRGQHGDDRPQAAGLPGSPSVWPAGPSSVQRVRQAFDEVAPAIRRWTSLNGSGDPDDGYVRGERADDRHAERVPDHMGDPRPEVQPCSVGPASGRVVEPHDARRLPRQGVRPVSKAISCDRFLGGQTVRSEVWRSEMSDAGCSRPLRSH